MGLIMYETKLPLQLMAVIEKLVMTSVISLSGLFSLTQQLFPGPLQFGRLQFRL